MVQPRRHLELRAGDAHPQGRRTARSKPTDSAGQASTPRRLGPLPARSRELRIRRRRRPASLFNAGWYGGDDSADSPEMLDVALDKPTYKPARRPSCASRRKQGGKALVAVLGSGLLSIEGGRSAKGGGDVAIAVGSDWGAGAYVDGDCSTARWTRRRSACRAAPSASSGWRSIRRHARSRSRSTRREKVKSGHSAHGAGQDRRPRARARRRASRSPRSMSASSISRASRRRRPKRWFYAQRKLGIEIRDFYGRLIDGMRAERGKLRSGGDGRAAAWP